MLIQKQQEKPNIALYYVPQFIVILAIIFKGLFFK